MNARLSALVRLLLVVSLVSSCASIISATRSEPIKEDYGKRSFGRFIDDAIVETKARVNLKKADPELAKAHLGVTSFNGVVLLAGQVPTQELKELAGRVTSEVRNVRRLHNELSIAGPISMPARANDAWLTSKVKTKLLAAKQIRGRRIKVVTENGVVHLMGLVSRAEADRVVEVVKGTFGIQKIVRIFEYID